MSRQDSTSARSPSARPTAGDDAEAGRSVVDAETTAAPSRRPVGVDLFAGAGGLSLAALRVGIKVVAAVENDRNACRTYRRNLLGHYRSGTRLFPENILELDPQRMIEEVPVLANGCDVILGGPPCQGFSSHRFKDQGVGDPRNALLLRYFDFVAALKPTVFFVENVPGLLWPRHREHLDRFLRLADEAGYEVQRPETLNAADYGVPQRRRRVFIVGTARSVGLKIAWPPTQTYRQPRGVPRRLEHLPEWRRAAEVFAVPVEQDDLNGVHMNPSTKMLEVFQRTPINGGSRRDSGRILKCHDRHDGHSDVYGRIDPSKPGPTMTTACINPSKGRFVHPTEHHGITLRHAARFQTFPDDFVFEGGLMSGGEQIGNAVPVLLGECLLRPITAALLAAEVSGT